MAMYNIRVKITLLLLAAGIAPLAAQEQVKDQKSAFSLKEAIDYALAHNQNHLNAVLEKKSAEYRNKEYTGIGLPQINGSADLKDYLTIPTTMIPGEFSGGAPGTFRPVQFGTKYNASYGISVSQIIFNSDYIVGLEAAKELVNLSEKNINRSKVETQAMVTKAYYGAIIAKERLKIIDANIERIKKLFDDTKALNVAGFTEKLDVERVELTYNNLLAEKEKLERFVGLSETLLKFQMGYDLSSPITLTDLITPEIMIDIQSLEADKVNYESRPEYAMLESQRNINSIELKRYKYQYLPSLAAYGSWMQQAQRTKFDVFDFDQPWFGITLIGATLNVPIFAGGQKHFRVQQSKVGLQRTQNSIDFLRRSIDLEIRQTSIQFKNAYVALETQRKNKDLAKSIYDTSKIKYDTGVGSNLDVIYAQAAYREAEINFLGAVYDLIVAQVDYLKAKGTLVK